MFQMFQMILLILMTLTSLTTPDDFKQFLMTPLTKILRDPGLPFTHFEAIHGGDILFQTMNTGCVLSEVLGLD